MVNGSKDKIIFNEPFKSSNSSLPQIHNITDKFYLFLSEESKALLKRELVMGRLKKILYK